MKRDALILTLIAALILTSCASGTGETADTTAPTSSDTTVDTSLRENTPDSLPDGLDFGGETVIIYHSTGDNVTDDLYGSEEETGDVVKDAVFRRNRSVEERLNIKFDFIDCGFGNGGEIAADIRSYVLADEDAFDIIDMTQFYAPVLVMEGLMQDLIDAPYIDYSQPWWQTEYMDTASITANQRHMLVGDFTTTRLGCSSAIFVNTSLMTTISGNHTDFYDMVLNGGWTMDVMRQYIAQAYQDLNGDGNTDYDDILGMVTTPVSPTEHFGFCAGLRFTERDSDGLPVLITNQEHNVSVIEKMYALFFETEGVRYDPDWRTLDAIQLSTFIDGRVLFYPGRISYAAELREMKDSYGIIPFPKFDDSQKEYGALMHDTVMVMMLPITNPDVDVACAAIEALAAEGYRQVIPAYYEVALKVKYAQDEVSVQLLDLISEATTSDYMYISNYVFEEGGAGGLGLITRTLMEAKSKDYMSTYDSIAPKVTALIESYAEKFELR